MTTIWKFPAFAEATALVGDDPMIVHVGKDPQGEVCVWIEHDPAPEMKPVEWLIVGTGHSFDQTGKVHVGSVVDGAFVWHVYQVL
jgi:hypothetical protein